VNSPVLRLSGLLGMKKKSRLPPDWVLRAVALSYPLRLGPRYLWARFKLCGHCALHLHRGVVMKVGEDQYLGCGSCGYLPASRE
jgi:hypothetical protein